MTTNGRISGRALQRRRAIALELLGPICAICGTPTNPQAHWRSPDYPHLDHKVPLARGGNDDWPNMQIVHARCNLRKGDRITEPARQPGAYYHDHPCRGPGTPCPGHSRQW